VSKNIPPHLALLFLTIIYGSSFFVAKEVMPEYWTPNFFIFVRVIGATILFWLIRIVHKQRIKRKDILIMAICGFFGVAANQLLFFQGLNQTSAVDASVIMVSTPVLVTLFSFFILKTKLTTFKITGILIGLLGATYLIYLGGDSNAKESSSIGNLLVFLNATSYGIYIVVVKPLMVKYKPITVISTVFLFGSLYVTPFGLYEIKDTSFNLSQNAWFAVAFIVFFTTFCTYLLNAFALSILQPTVAASYIYLQPVFAMLTGVIFNFVNPENYHGVSITPPKIIAAGFIFLGVYLISKSSITKYTKNKLIS
jgi:drug/metabolite transporter (DMT)-like permease